MKEERGTNAIKRHVSLDEWRMNEDLKASEGTRYASIADFN